MYPDNTGEDIDMTYSVTWDIPGEVLSLRVLEEVSLEEFVEIDRQIRACLAEYIERLSLVVDASQLRISPHSIERIRVSQSYLLSGQIKQILVVSNNKLNRLSMLLLFNLCRPRLRFCESFDHAQRILDLSRS